jgi:hypothetical protein
MVGRHWSSGGRHPASRKRAQAGAKHPPNGAGLDRLHQRAALAQRRISRAALRQLRVERDAKPVSLSAPTVPPSPICNPLMLSPGIAVHGDGVGNVVALGAQAEPHAHRANGRPLRSAFQRGWARSSAYKASCSESLPTLSPFIYHGGLQHGATQECKLAVAQR